MRIRSIFLPLILPLKPDSKDYFTTSLMSAQSSKAHSPRRHLISVIGDARSHEKGIAYLQALELGERLVDAGYRVCSGGLGGIMTAVFIGARQSARYKEGDTVAIIPTLDKEQANPYADIVIATGMGHLRNGIVSAADAVVVVGGKTGTLSEMAMAWCYNRLVVALSGTGGIAAHYAGKALDQRGHRRRHPALERIADAATPAQVVEIIHKNLPDCYIPVKGFPE